MPLAFSRCVKTTQITGGSAPSNANDGRDPIGFALSGATYDHAGHAQGARVVELASAFDSYVHVAGDWFYVTAATGGMSVGAYRILSSPTGDHLLLADDPGLTADATGISSSNGPWLTPQYFADNLTWGEHGVIAADGGGAGGWWEESAQIDWDQAASGFYGRHVHGANARGNPDGTICVFSGVNIPAGADVWEIDDAGTGLVDGMHFYDFRITGAGNAARCVRHDSASGSVYHSWRRCRFDDATDTGASSFGVARYEDCEFDNNAYGFQPRNTTTDVRYGFTFLRCRFHDNSVASIRGSGMKAIFCTFVDEPDAFQFYRTTSDSFFDHCVFQNLTGRAFQSMTSSAAELWGAPSVTNCIFADLVTGVAQDTYGLGATQWRGNCIHNCGAPHFLGWFPGEGVPGWITGTDDTVYADPLFVSTTPGAKDLRLQAGSPCRGAGLGVAFG